MLSRELQSSAKIIEDLTRSGSSTAGPDGSDKVDPVQKSLMDVRIQLKAAEQRALDLEADKKEAEENARYYYS